MALPAMTPDLTNLELLLSIAEYGSLGQAGQAHEMSQPAVSMRMSRLEHQVGLKLFERSPSGTRLTVEGAAVADWAKRVVEATGAMMTAVSALRTASRTGLHVASSVTTADHLLADWLVALHTARPDIEISLEVHNSREVERIVQARQAELGFLASVSPPRGLHTRAVASDWLAIVVGNGHPWAKRRRPLTGPELAATPLIVREVGAGTREVLERALAPWGGPSPPLFEFGSNAAILGAVRRDQGPGAVGALAVADDVAFGRVVEVPTTGLDLCRTVRAVWRKGQTLSEPAQRLLRVARRSSAVRCAGNSSHRPESGSPFEP